MLNAKQVLICVVVALFIGGVSMEANAGEVSPTVKYNITCLVLAVGSEQEDKAQYYESLLPDVPMEDFDRVMRKVINTIYKHAGMQDVTTEVVSGYGFKNYGCDRPFI